MSASFDLPLHLTRLQLLLRLAAGQGVAEIAALFGLALARLERRAALLGNQVLAMRALRLLQPADRFNRLARMAHLRLHRAMQAGTLGARAFFRWSWSYNEDPAQRIAVLAEARLAGVDRVRLDRPGLRPPARPRPRPSPRQRLGHAALRFTLALRDEVIAEEGRALYCGWRRSNEEDRLDRRRTYVPLPPWWVTAFHVPPQPGLLWAALRLPGHAARPPPQGIPPKGRAVYLPARPNQPAPFTWVEPTAHAPG